MPTMIVTCNTEDCGNREVAIALEVDPDLPPDLYLCGVCGVPITDTRAGVDG